MHPRKRVHGPRPGWKLQKIALGPTGVRTQTSNNTNPFIPIDSILHPDIVKMASKHASRALRNSLRQLASPRVQQRTFTAAVNGSRPALQKAATSAFVQQTRGMKTVDFAGDKEVVYGEALQYRVLHKVDADIPFRARRLASRQAPGLLQERHPRSHRLRFARPWSRTESS